MLRKIMLLTAVLAMALAFAAPALAQDDPQVVADAKAKTAVAGGPSGATAEANCVDGMIESEAGGVVARAPCEPPPPPPPAPAPKAAPPPAPAPPAPAPMLPASGGVSLITLGAGALLVGGGLLVRRIIR